MKKVKNINFRIAELVAAAQVANDAGKGIERLKIKSAYYKEATRYGYQIKDRLILQAINLIDANRSDWRYYVEKRPDQNGNSSKIIYFTLNKAEGKYIQISFHSFAGGEIKQKALKNAGCKLYWDQRNSWKSAALAFRACGGHAYLSM